MPSPPSTLSSVARVVADTLREVYGIDPAPVLSGVGLDDAALHAPRGRFAFEKMQRLWQAAVAASGDAGFGLRAGERIRPTTFSVLGVTWMASGTLREAIHRLCRYSHIISTAPHALRLDEESRPCWLSFEYPDRYLQNPAVVVDAFFAGLITLARMASQPRLALAGLRLRHGDASRLDDYQRVFGCTPQLGQAVDAMGFDPAALDALLVGHESEIARGGDLAAEGYIREMNARPLATELQRLLVRLLPSGEATLEELARRMNRGVSTLQRQLQEEGIGYREVLEATRRALAEGYLADPRLSLGEIAYLLGFADQSSFTRAFGRWAGMSPRRFRDQRGRDAGAVTPPA